MPIIFQEKGDSTTKRYKINRAPGWRKVSLLMNTTVKQWWEDPDVVVAFNLPRISACLERLMGTNVVRLTDRNYMKVLRERIDEEYRETLQKRISARERKEVERERILIIEGKSDVIPDELADDPIFMVNKNANIEIQKQRAKLKTNREKNSERLKLQGVKWERERLLHEAEERKYEELKKERRREQNELVQRYKDEDAERGMNLLRIENEDWRECEQDLKRFLEEERAKMKERSMRVPTAYTSDQSDIQNIVRARQKFRETEHRIRKELEEGKTKPKVEEPTEQTSAHHLRIIELMSELEQPGDLASQFLSRDTFFDSQEDVRLRKFSDDMSDLVSDDELAEVGSTISESRRRHESELRADMEQDVQKGLLISKEQYNHLRYEEEKINQLKAARDIRELYRIAEEIIIGDTPEIEEVEEPAADAGEEEQAEEENT